MNDLMYRRYWVACGAAFVLLVIFLSLNTDPLDFGRTFDVKIGHCIAYGWLMLWFAQLAKTSKARVGVAIGLVAMGVLLEYVQRETGYRTFSYLDMRDNAIGVAIGFMLGLTPLSGSLAAFERLVFSR